MNRIFNSILIKNKNLHYLNNSKLNQILSRLNTTDSFGIGSKYSDLDSVKTKIQIPRKEKRVYKIKENKPENLKSDPDVFGTLSNELNDIEFKTSISYSKPISEIESLKNESKEDEENEKKYDKILNHIRLSNEDRPNTEKFYGNKINELANQGKIKEAIDVFYLEMIGKDRFRPTLWLYKTLMRHLAQCGYTHMVFEIFKKLTSSKDDDWNESKNVTKLHQIITILFQACANSPWAEYSIRKCDSIRFYLKNRQIIPNLKNYSAMILAYGKAGAIYESFNVVDEMTENKLKPDVSIFNNLLCACLSQPDYGYRYALMTWQMCLKFKIVPDLTMYNLLLKAANDCSISVKKERIYLPDLDKKNKHRLPLNDNINLFPQNSDEHKLFLDEDYENLNSNNKSLLKQKNSDILKLNIETHNKIDRNKDLIPLESNNVIKLSPSDVHVIDDLKAVGTSIEKQIKNLEWWQDIKTNIDKTELLKGLTKFRPDLKDIILAQSYESVLTRVNNTIEKDLFEFVTSEQDTPEGHLNILGGIHGVFKSMTSHQIKPDFKFFNIMIQLIPNNLQSEEELMIKMQKYELKPDIDFINFLIKRRISRKEFHEANLAFKMIQDNNLSPNIITFGCLANKINNYNLLVQFFDDLKNMNLKLNPIIITTLYTKCRFRKDINSLNYLFNYILENDIKIDTKLKNKIETDLENTKKDIIEKEKKKDMSEKEKFDYNKLRKFYNFFKNEAEKWLEDVKFEKEFHPYSKFSRKDDHFYKDFLTKTEKMKLKENI